MYNTIRTGKHRKRRRLRRTMRRFSGIGGAAPTNGRPEAKRCPRISGSVFCDFRLKHRRRLKNKIKIQSAYDRPYGNYIESDIERDCVNTLQSILFYICFLKKLRLKMNGQTDVGGFSVRSFRVDVQDNRPSNAGLSFNTDNLYADRSRTRYCRGGSNAQVITWSDTRKKKKGRGKCCQYVHSQKYWWRRSPSNDVRRSPSPRCGKSLGVMYPVYGTRANFLLFFVVETLFTLNTQTRVIPKARSFNDRVLLLHTHRPSLVCFRPRGRTSPPPIKPSDSPSVNKGKTKSHRVPPRVVKCFDRVNFKRIVRLAPNTGLKILYILPESQRIQLK